VVRILGGTEGPVIAASDYLKAVQDQIAPWLSGRLCSLGTDGFGRSDSRLVLRRHFEVDAESIAAAALAQLVRQRKFPAREAADALKEMGLDPERADPLLA
jgi:pyruvate dehydrogenase E1 component